MNVDLTQIILIVLVVNLVFQIIWMFILYERLLREKDKKRQEILKKENELSFTK